MKELPALLSDCDSLEKKAAKYVEHYLENPDNISGEDITELLKEAYQVAIMLFDAKKSLVGDLLQEEKAIYDICKTELENGADGQLQGYLAAALGALSIIRNIISALSGWFGGDQVANEAGLALASEGNEVLPGYASLLQEAFITLHHLFDTYSLDLLRDLALAQMDCALNLTEHRPVNSQRAEAMLELAGYAYEGFIGTDPNGWLTMPVNILPAAIHPLYDGSTGLLKSSHGFCAWLGINNATSSVAIAFSGTQLTNFDMVLADLLQLAYPSILYLKAAGLVRMVSEHFPDSIIYITGHSLGGGLAMFSLAANINGYAGRMFGFAYNPAGLSAVSLNALGLHRLNMAKYIMEVYMTCFDPVSTFGGKFGCLTTLPRSNNNGHSMDALRACMALFARNATPSQSAALELTAYCRREYDLIPNEREIYIRDSSGSIYPIFCQEHVFDSRNPQESFSVNNGLFSKLGIKSEADEPCLCVYNLFNGTGRTVLNRLKLMSETTCKDDEVLIGEVDVGGGIRSGVIFGHYGLGSESFIAFARNAYVESGAIFNSRQSFELLAARISDHFTYDKADWMEVFKQLIKKDLKVAFTKKPNLEKELDRVLKDLISGREDVFRKFQTAKPPTDEVKKELRESLKLLFDEHCEKMLNRLVEEDLLSSGEKNTLLEELASCFKCMGMRMRTPSTIERLLQWILRLISYFAPNSPKRGSP